MSTNVRRASEKTGATFGTLPDIPGHFWIISDSFDNDKYIKVSGNAELYNSTISSSINLVNDSTIISRKDRKFEINATKTRLTFGLQED